MTIRTLRPVFRNPLALAAPDAALKQAAVLRTQYPTVQR